MLCLGTALGAWRRISVFSLPPPHQKKTLLKTKGFYLVNTRLAPSPMQCPELLGAARGMGGEFASLFLCKRLGWRQLLLSLRAFPYSLCLCFEGLLKMVREMR